MNEITKDTPFDSVQSILDNGGIIQVAPGEYNMTKSMYLSSNTLILMPPNAVFRRCMTEPIFRTKVTKTTKGYSGSKNIKIDGGKLIGNGENAGYGNTVSLAHADAITIINTIIEDTMGSHGIEINSSRGVTLRDVAFNGYIANPDGAYREAIQLDFANYLALTTVNDKNALCYDDTHCEDILIEHCQFGKSDKNQAPIIAIGTHTQTVSANKHRNIRILHNDAAGRGLYKGYGFFLSLANMEDVTVDDNRLWNYTRFCRIATFDTAYKKDGTRVDNVKGTQGGCVNVTFTNNIQRDITDDYQDFGIFAYSKSAARHQNIRIINQIFDVNPGNKKNGYAADLQCVDVGLVQGNTVIGLNGDNHFRDVKSTGIVYL